MPPLSSIKITGDKEMADRISKVAKAFPDKARGALYRQLQYIMTDSKLECPVLDGHLRASGVTLLDDDPRTIAGTLGFGGPAGTGNHGGETNDGDVGYAVVQHEKTGFKHTVGKAKFLEDPLKARATLILPDMAEDLKDEF